MTAKITTVPTPWHDRNALNLVHLISDGTGDTALKATPLFRIGQVNMGIQIQAVGCTITPSLTLGNPDDAIDLTAPEAQARIRWKTLAPVNDGDMILFPYAATAVKLHFSGAGEALLTSF